MRNFVCQSLLVDRPDLLQQNNGIPVKPVRFRLDLNMRGKLCLLDLRCNSRNDYRWAESIADIVLDHEHGTDTALLGPDDW